MSSDFNFEGIIRNLMQIHFQKVINNYHIHIIIYIKHNIHVAPLKTSHLNLHINTFYIY